jgi:GR25 family glycosyltransferase involved in LPS biosynthesis
MNANSIQGFIITASHEKNRLANVQQLQLQLPDIQLIEAIYPSKQKVPFLHQLVNKSKERTGRSLNFGEIGVLLSNRKIWHTISKTDVPDNTPFLILESDSVLNDPDVLKNNFHLLTAQYDLFFWGGWLGHIQLLRSTRIKINSKFNYGTPFIKTICSGYGYSINKKTAKYLLQQTKEIAYPVDEFKKYIDPNRLKIGAVVPELIAQGDGVSTIGHNGLSPVKEKIWFLLLDIRNYFICLFN